MASHYFVNNRLTVGVTIATFKNSEFRAFEGLFDIRGRAKVQVKAGENNQGLHVAVVYEKTTDLLLYRRWHCKNGSTLHITGISGERVQAQGCSYTGRGSVPTVPIEDDDTFSEGYLGDWTICSGSNECINGCCSSKYSEGVLKCTPLEGGYRSDFCIDPPPSVFSPSKLGDWRNCMMSIECRNGCCSGHYSNGETKCTPLNGGFRPDLCLQPGPDARYLRFVGMNDREPLN